MTPTQAENLRILIRHMETKCQRVLDMDTYQRCGTPACAIGEAALIPQFNLKFEGDHALLYCGFRSADDAAAELFGLDTPAKNYRLFGLPGTNAWGCQYITPQEWAAEGRKVLAENGYSMDDKPAEFIALVRSWEADPIPMWDIA